MSDMEMNKGKLVPVGSLEEIAEKVVGSVDPIYETKAECFIDEAVELGYFIAPDGTVYRIEWEVQRDRNSHEFSFTTHQDDGTIDFHTYHYNGACHWTELVEMDLEKGPKV